MSTQNIFLFGIIFLQKIYIKTKGKTEKQAKNHVQNLIYTHLEKKKELQCSADFQTCVTAVIKQDNQTQNVLLNWQQRVQTDRFSQKYVSAYRLVLWLFFSCSISKP